MAILQTWPNRDELHADVEVCAVCELVTLLLTVQIIQLGWNDLKAVFGPTNVLVVSNSAGTNKDPGGIAVRTMREMHVTC